MCYININKDILTEPEYQFIKLCQSEVAYDVKFVCICEDSNILEYNQKYAHSLCDAVIDSEYPEMSIFNILIYRYQLVFEKKYILSDDFTEHVQSIQPYFKHINHVASKYTNLTFEKYVHKNKWVGIADIVDNTNGRVIELKFRSSLSATDDLQAIIYHSCLYAPNRSWTKKKAVSVLNMCDGTMRDITFTKVSKCKEFSKFLRKQIGI